MNMKYLKISAFLNTKTKEIDHVGNAPVIPFDVMEDAPMHAIVTLYKNQ